MPVYQKIHDTPYMKKPSILIIGGGINGAGVARDAALRGYHVGLFEKNDFASGTSWTSSKLIHGGLRYLEHGEIGLVRESLREREILLHQHPHLVRPIRLTVPIYRHGKYGRLAMRAGMWAYDLLSFDKSLPRFSLYTHRAVRARYPGINAQSLLGGVSYFDAQAIYPERLVLDNIHSAVRYGAEVYNHTEVTGFLKSKERITGVQTRNTLTGEEAEYTADMVINTSGPWVDHILKHTEKNIPPQLGGTKGSHIVIRNTIALQDALYVNARRDGRPFFIIPWLDYILIGTTDLRYEGHPDTVFPESHEIDYLIEEATHVMPELISGRDDIVFSFCGIRPLPRDERRHTGAITRRHGILDHQREGAEGLISLIGGKLTTYRSAAEQMVDHIEKSLGIAMQPCRTATEPMHPLMHHDTELLPLTAMLGSDAGAAAQMAQQKNWSLSPVAPDYQTSEAQIRYAVQEEWARTLSDVMLRRTRLAYSPDNGLPVAHGVASIMGSALAWPQERTTAEIQAYTAYVNAYLQAHRHRS